MFRNEAILTSELPQSPIILASLGQAAFVWDLASDVICRIDHVGAVFTDVPLPQLCNGAEFGKLIEPDRSIRSEIMRQAAPLHGAGGTPYRIEYGVRTHASAPLIWVEETGCWFAGPDGRPS